MTCYVGKDQYFFYKKAIMKTGLIFHAIAAARQFYSQHGNIWYDLSGFPFSAQEILQNFNATRWRFGI